MLKAKEGRDMRLKKSSENKLREKGFLWLSSIFAGVSSIILFCALFFDGETYSIHNYNVFLVILASAAWGVLLFCIYNVITKMKAKISIKKEALLVAAVLALLLAIMVLISRTLAVYYSWDPNEILWGIKEYFDGGKIGNLVYFTHYPFQLFLVAIEIIFIKLVWHFGIVMSIEGAQMLLNMIFILGTFLVTYLIVRKLFDKKRAMFGLILLTSFSPVLLYTPILYTDTTSMFFIALGFYLFLWLIDKKIKNWWVRILLAIGFSLAEFFAFELKATAGIAIIAMAMYLMLTFKKAYLRQFVACLVVFLIVFLGGFFLVRKLESNVVDLSKQTPVTHWLMMAQQNYGDYNVDDADTTFEIIENGEDAKAYNIETIKTRVTERGVWGNLEFLGKKISYVWGDGTYYVSAQLDKLPRTPESLMFKIFGASGKYNIVYLYVAHGLQLFMLAIFCYGAFLTRKNRDWSIMIKLIVIGLFVFFLFWETTSRYLLNYVPLFTVLIVYFIDKIAKEVKVSVIIKEKKVIHE